jgi:hypothetical protein
MTGNVDSCEIVYQTTWDGEFFDRVQESFTWVKGPPLNSDETARGIYIIDVAAALTSGWG